MIITIIFKFNEIMSEENISMNDVTNMTTYQKIHQEINHDSEAEPDSDSEAEPDSEAEDKEVPEEGKHDEDDGIRTPESTEVPKYMYLPEETDDEEEENDMKPLDLSSTSKYCLTDEEDRIVGNKVNRFFSHTIGELLKIRLARDKRRKTD